MIRQTMSNRKNVDEDYFLFFDLVPSIAIALTVHFVYQQ
jgi:hypothetical protein